MNGRIVITVSFLMTCLAAILGCGEAITASPEPGAAPLVRQPVVFAITARGARLTKDGQRVVSIRITLGESGRGGARSSTEFRQPGPGHAYLLGTLVVTNRSATVAEFNGEYLAAHDNHGSPLSLWLLAADPQKGYVSNELRKLTVGPRESAELQFMVEIVETDRSLSLRYSSGPSCNVIAEGLPETGPIRSTEADGTSNRNNQPPHEHEDRPTTASEAHTPPLRVRGWGQATVRATVVNSSGACALAFAPFRLVSSYAVEEGDGESRPSNYKFVYGGCEDLEKKYRNLVAVVVHVESAQPIALPLKQASAKLMSVRRSGKTSVALLAPLTANSTEPWLLTPKAGLLVVNIDPGWPADLVFLFYKPNLQNAKVDVAERQVAIDGDDGRICVETHRQWELEEPRLVQFAETCVTNATNMRREGEGYSAGGVVQMVNNQFRLWCPGARHQWLGKSQDIEKVFTWIVSSESSPLEMEVTAKGYRYAKGSGIVQLQTGPTIRLGPFGSESSTCKTWRSSDAQ